MSQSKELTEGESRSTINRSKVDRFGILILGLNIWVVSIGWPMLIADRPSGFVLFLSPIPLIFLGMGTVLMHRRAEMGQWILLALYPISLTVLITHRDEPTNLLTYSPEVLFFSVTSLAVYGFFTASALTYQETVYPVNYKPLQQHSPQLEKARTRNSWLQSTVVAIVSIGILLIAVVGPTTDRGYPSLRKNWANAALQGGLLTALIGGSLAMAVLALFLGPVLRNGQLPPVPKRVLIRRIVSYLILGIVGFLTYFLTY